MEVKPGYKQTEVGVIPEDWSVASFEGAFRKLNSKKHQIQTSAYQETGSIPVIDQGQTAVVGFTDQAEKVFRCPENGVVVFGDHTCIVKFVDFDFVVGADGTQLLAAMAGHSARFHAFALQHRGVPTTGYNRHFKFLKERSFASPPPPEQRAIAEALSDVDALLARLDHLIAKKRDLKQAAMQQLLTGQTRLPEFKGEWEVKMLGDLGLTYGGLTGKTKADFGEGAARYITFMNVMSNVVVDCGIFEQVRVSATESQNPAMKGDLFFNGSSETPEEVAMCSVLLDEVRDVYLNSFCFGFRFRDCAQANGLFLAYYFRSREGRELMKSLAQGSTRYNLSKVALLKSPLRLPKLPEQTAIAEVLTDMDAELAALEQRWEKSRDLKQAMMQELLTGKTRLV